MELRQLRYFMAVADTLSFSRASESLFVSQPTISQQIAALEGELGVSLLRRDRHSVELTPAGQELFLRGRELLDRADELGPRLRRIGAEQQQVQSLTMAVDANDDHLDRIGALKTIVYLRQLHPEFNLTMRTMTYQRARAAVREREVDMGLYTITSIESREVSPEIEIIDRDTFGLLVPAYFLRQHPDATALDVLAHFDLYLLRSDTRWDSYLIQKLRELKPSFHPQYLDNTQVIYSYMMAGMGVLLTPSKLVSVNISQSDSQYVGLVPVEVPDLFCAEAVLRQKDNPNPLLEEFLDKLKSFL